MRLKKEIDALTKKVDDVEFPQPSPSSWEHFLVGLKEVVAENIGYGASKSLTWDEYNGKFYFDLTEPVDLGDFRCHVRHTFDLNPRTDIMGELERLQDEIARWKNTLGCAASHLYREQVKAAVESGGSLPKAPMGLHLAEDE
jgi:hypothetical protein